MGFTLGVTQSMKFLYGILKGKPMVTCQFSLYVNVLSEIVANIHAMLGIQKNIISIGLTRLQLWLLTVRGLNVIIRARIDYVID